MSDAPPAPFTFKAAPTRKVTIQKVEDMPSEAEAAPKRARKLKPPAEVPTAKKTRKRRARLPDDVAVLKACLKQLRTLDPKDALRTVETLRVLFK